MFLIILPHPSPGLDCWGLQVNSQLDKVKRLIGVLPGFFTFSRY